MGKRVKIAVRANRMACLRVYACANVGADYTPGRGERRRIEEGFADIGIRTLRRWGGSANTKAHRPLEPACDRQAQNKQDASAPFERELSERLAGFFSGDLSAFFARFGKSDGDGLLAALYRPALSSFCGR